MKSSQILKELFLLQNQKEQLKIIRDYNIKIDGFSHIDINILNRFKPKISDDLTNKRNYKNLINKNIENSKRFDYKMDVYLDSSKIIEKHGKKWDELLQIILKDNFGQQSVEIINALKEKTNAYIEGNEKLYKSSIDQEDLSEKNNELRRIISELEKKSKKIKGDYTELKKDFNALNDKYLIKQEQLKKEKELNDEIQNKNETMNQKLIKYKMDLKDNQDENEKLLNKIHELTNRNTKLENLISKINIHIIGFDKEILKDCEHAVVSYSIKEVDEFIKQSKVNKNDIFYAYKFGVPTSILFKLKQVENINIKSNLSKIRGDI